MVFIIVTIIASDPLYLLRDVGKGGTTPSSEGGSGGGGQILYIFYIKCSGRDQCTYNLFIKSHLKRPPLNSTATTKLVSQA